MVFVAYFPNFLQSPYFSNIFQKGTNASAIWHISQLLIKENSFLMIEEFEGFLQKDIAICSCTHAVPKIVNICTRSFPSSRKSRIETPLKMSLMIIIYSMQWQGQASQAHFYLYVYRKVASSRPVYYSILNSLCQRSQYISIKFLLHKQSENS